jgi:C4-dicarboxylate transporter DctM subunit
LDPFSAFITCGIANVSVDRATGDMLPYILFLCLGLLVITFVPWVALVLPRLLNLV